MSKKSIYTLLPLLCIVIIFGWILYSILSYDNYYYGGALTKLQTVINRKPVFYFDSDGRNSFYDFTTNEYQSQFRISEGALDLVRENGTLRKQIEQLKNGDSISIDIRNDETKKLATGSNGIKVIGLSAGNKLLIDPVSVKTIERGNKTGRILFNYLLLLILIVFIIKAYIKSRVKK